MPGRAQELVKWGTNSSKLRALLDGVKNDWDGLVMGPCNGPPARRPAAG